MPELRRAVVAGGGIAGLVWALEAATRGAAVTVLEAAERPGGAVRRGRVGPATAELGAEAFAVARPEVLALVEELGLADQVVRPAVHQAHLATRRGLVALPTGFLGIPVDLDDVARLLGREAAAEAARRDAVPVSPDEALPVTLGGLVRDRLGDAVATQLVDPVVAGVHATPADEAELASVAPPLADAVRRHGSLVAAARALRGPLGPAGAPVASLDGGLSRLVDALVGRLEALGGTIRTGTGATGLHRRPDGWRVTTDRGHLDAEVVGLALPVDVAVHLLRVALRGAPTRDGIASAQTDAPLAGIVRELAELRHTEVTLVSLVVEDPTLRAAGAPVGSGVLVAPDVGAVRAKAMTHASAKWAHVAAALPTDHHLLRLSYGGRSGSAQGRRPGIEEAGASDEQLVRTALADAVWLLGDAAGAPALRGARVTRWPHGLVRPLVGRRAAVDRIDADLRALPDLALVGGALAGNGLAGVVARSRSEATRTLGATPPKPGRSGPTTSVPARTAGDAHPAPRRTDVADPGATHDVDELNRTVRYTVWAVYARSDASASLPEGDGGLGAWADGLAAEDIVLRGLYDVSGLRAEADVMVWLHGPSADALQAALRGFRRTAAGATTTLAWSAMGTHRPAEFSRDHVPSFMRDTQPLTWLCVYPFVRSYEWYLLPDDERRDMLREHGMAGRAFPDVQPNTVAAFALNDYEWMLALESDELHDLVDMMRDLRATRARLHVREEIPFYTGRLVDVAGAVEVLR